MHFTKPAWVIHKDSAKSEQNPKRLSIFSIHVHPDGSRIATGGLDAKIRIWSTKPILNEASEQSGKPPKSLCTLTMHSGPVLTVRWAHSGKWLASGSDDETVMIWDHDPNARGRVWGSDEVNVEGWKPLKRLPGHESDVTDVAWSPGDRYLASVGLDSAVIIWCGYTLERLRKLDQHQGFVKGVCWDPVGEFLATQSDDRTVKIWKTTDWSLEAEVRKPFEDSPGSTFFRRLSWSPDGAHITASNATNNKGYVFIAAVITRNTWTSEISLVGHENTVEVAAYNPHIFLRNTSAPVSTSNICSVVALGADDRSVSVWQTKSARPLIVAKEVFERQIMDLSWSWDGLTLYAASSDGTIAAFQFDATELEGIATRADQEQYLAKFGFVPPPLPDGYSHVSSNPQPTPMPSAANGFSFEADNQEEKVNILVAKRAPKDKKRATLVGSSSSIPSAGQTASISAPPTAGPKRVQLTQLNGQSSKPTPIAPSRAFSTSSFPAPEEQPFSDAMDIDIPIKKFGEKPAEVPIVKSISTWGAGGLVPQPRAWTESSRPEAILPVPALVSYLTVTVDDSSTDTFEAKNTEETKTIEVIFSQGKEIFWIDYLPSPVLCVKATSRFSAAALQDGSVVVWTPTGRRAMPTLCLGSPCSVMEGCKNSLLVITTTGQVYSWNVKKQAANFPPVSLLTLYAMSPNISIVSASIRENGVPIINCSNNVVYAYDSSLSCWIVLADRWWSESSEFGQGRRRSSISSAAGRGVMASIESSIAPSLEEATSDPLRPEFWQTIITLGHLETRIMSARFLESPQEFKQALLQYAKHLAQNSLVGMAEEMIKELLGPVYRRPDREDAWSPTVVGFSKWELLKEVLLVFARNKDLSRLAQEWQETLKKATDDSY
ncbi:hypothetical protein CVT24_003003 [Panaeolus cyanescens]|uniref:Protein HIR n=1 Tax=Panaeolus cyanescens TaxID=181874 RepID=A0A409VFT3_9AGAR|nr:hypothetical protein CVT24_003003 [Panaeolus cyanescens]